MWYTVWDNRDIYAYLSNYKNIANGRLTNWRVHVVLQVYQKCNMTYDHVMGDRPPKGHLNLNCSSNGTLSISIVIENLLQKHKYSGWLRATKRAIEFFCSHRTASAGTQQCIFWNWIKWKYLFFGESIKALRHMQINRSIHWSIPCFRIWILVI